MATVIGSRVSGKEILIFLHADFSVLKFNKYLHLWTQVSMEE
jgi:hypothetical protein